MGVENYINQNQETQLNQITPQDQTLQNNTQHNITDQPEIEQPKEQPKNGYGFGKGFISRTAQKVGDGIKKGAKWAYNNRENIGNVVSNVGSRLSAAAYGGSGGQYGQAWGATSAGMRQQHKQGLDTLEKQGQVNKDIAGGTVIDVNKASAEAQAEAQKNVAGGTTRELQAEQLEHQTREREASENFTARQQDLARQATEALQSGQLQHAKELQQELFKHTVSESALDREQQAKLLELQSSLSVQQQLNLWQAMANIPEDDRDRMSLVYRALSGVSDAEFNQKMANMDAQTLDTLARTAMRIIDALKPTVQASRAHGGYVDKPKKQKLNQLNKWNRQKSKKKV